MVQAGLTTPNRVLARLATVGPLERRGVLEGILVDLGGRRPESWFHDIVLTELEHLGYSVEQQPRELDTPDGRGIRVDIPIGPFQVGVEPAGDRYHRSARARRNDRRRTGQAAGTDWLLVPVDWRDWHDRREWMLETIDAAILRQLERGIGSPRDLPRHLADEWRKRVQ